MSRIKEALPQSDVESRLKSFPNWTQKNNALVRVLEFPTYLDGLEFVNKLGHEAERMDHHPSIVLDYKKVTVKYSTHSAGGITELDFQAAELVDRLAREPALRK